MRTTCAARLARSDGAMVDLELVRPHVHGRRLGLVGLIVRVVDLEPVQQGAAAFDAAVEDVDVAEEVHHEAVGRVLEDLLRRADLLDCARGS